MTKTLPILMLDKKGQRVNSAGTVINEKGETLDGFEPSTVHTNYKISTFSGEAAIEHSFYVQHVLQAHVVSGQGDLMDLMDRKDIERLNETQKSKDEKPKDKDSDVDAADPFEKYTGGMLRIQGEILSKLKPAEMMDLFKRLLAGVIVGSVPGMDSMDHFAKNKSHILPVLKEIIRVNDFLELDLTVLLN